jgi:lipopolysaccharide/colanic/teichoic acid biosynthesis glycosyltransferase
MKVQIRKSAVLKFAVATFATGVLISYLSRFTFPALALPRAAQPRTNRRTVNPARTPSTVAAQENLTKRVVDCGLALFGLIVASPVLAAVALTIKVTSPGPILYTQTRVGRHGKTFRLYKFRSMVVNADKLGSSVTRSHDPRITPIGRLLRRSKLDELPQLLNVVKGEMSLVGPRPDVPEIVGTYSRALQPILSVRPGMTSLASVYLKDEDEYLALAKDPDAAYVALIVPAKLTIDMEHVSRNSCWFDLSVVFLTVWALSFGRLFPQAEHPQVAALRASLTATAKRATTEIAKVVAPAPVVVVETPVATPAMTFTPIEPIPARTAATDPFDSGIYDFEPETEMTEAAESDDLLSHEFPEWFAAEPEFVHTKA